MPWNGAGTYTLPPAFFPEANGNVVDATRYNGVLNDIATGVNKALAKDGQNAASANIPMASFKFTGLGPGTAAGQALVYGQTSVGLISAAFGVGLPTNTTQKFTVDRLTGTSIFPPSFPSGNVAAFMGSSLPGSPSGITLIAGNTANSSVYFGDTDAADSGAIKYQHTTDTLEFWAGATKYLSIKNITNDVVVEAGTLRVDNIYPVTGFAYSLSSAGILSQAANGRFGYSAGAGAGGVVTQGVGASKNVTVAINKPTGQITTNNAALAAGAVVSFRVTNTLAINYDKFLPLISLIGGGSADTYVITGVFPDTGGFSVQIHNASGVSRSEALVLHYVLFQIATT